MNRSTSMVVIDLSAWTKILLASSNINGKAVPNILALMILVLLQESLAPGLVQAQQRDPAASLDKI